MMKNSGLKYFVVLLLLSLAFIYGFLVSDKQIFPHTLLKSLYYETSIYKAADISKMDRDWAKKLAKGGYILHIRHAQREKWIDVTAFDALELASDIKAEDSSFNKAVCLTNQGDEEAKLIGEIFKLGSININEVISSPSCRARETAMLAFGRIDSISNSLLHRTAMTVNQHLPMAIRLREVIDNLVLPEGQNVVLSGHGGTLSYNTHVVIDKNNIGELDDRDETGIIILSKKNERVTADYKYNSIWHLANSFIEFEVN